MSGSVNLPRKRDTIDLSEFCSKGKQSKKSGVKLTEKSSCFCLGSWVVSFETGMPPVKSVSRVGFTVVHTLCVPQDLEQDFQNHL
jgi:hypothetical protein